MSNPVFVTLDQFNAGRTNFQNHYFLESCNSTFYGQDIRLDWGKFYAAVTGFIKKYSADPSTIALRFVYCYDTASTSLYLRLQILTMSADTTIANQYNLNATPSAWYSITEAGIAETKVSDLSDSAYLSGFYYCDSGSCSASSVQQLSADSDSFAQNIVFPWALEVLQMYADNGNPTGGCIGFAACAFTGDSSEPVAYPHTLVLYLTDSSGQALIDNNPCTGFQGKAADYGTLCPEKCNVYISPF